MHEYLRQLPDVRSFLIDHHEIFQILFCVGGTAIGAALIAIGYGSRNIYLFGKVTGAHAAFVSLLVLGCLAYFGPLPTLNGDGSIHQAKIWFVANSLRNGALPEWTFFGSAATS